MYVKKDSLSIQVRIAWITAIIYVVVATIDDIFTFDVVPEKASIVFILAIVVILWDWFKNEFKRQRYKSLYTFLNRDQRELSIYKKYFRQNSESDKSKESDTILGTLFTVLIALIVVTILAYFEIL